MAFRWIHKVGLALIVEGKLLVVRKRGTDVFILPGGKPEGDETDLQTLARELNEELGCGLKRPFLRGVFTDVAAGASDAVVVVRLYSAELVGEPAPRSEIEELAWADIRGVWKRPLAPSIRNGILPFLRKREKASSKSRDKIASEKLQGLLEIV